MGIDLGRSTEKRKQDQDRRVYNSRVHECRSSMHTEMAAMAERLHLRHRLRLHHQQVLQLLR
uniref:Uncharacterized protein n=1 Tax=Oryza sativa subsp. japonica TaxID=39947 RepID=Q8H4F7_ORYSJ|nr:hypothetical protein [Oryza sativa Japonica Group]BAD03732.1 hypothetical protein [Oryza sativa Japonica Group]